MTEFFIVKEPPVVELIGMTMPIESGIQRALDHRDNVWNTEPIAGDPLALVEFGGRGCYESYSNKLQRSRLEYIKDTAINKEHGSILEHAYFNFAVLDLPRNALMELTRHRAGTAYSWRSTRYVDNWVGYSLPPLLRGSGTQVEWIEEAKRNFDHYQRLKKDLKFLYPDLSKKQIVEAARSVLWGNCVTDGEFSCNLRALIHIHKLRSDKGADAMMQEFAEELYQVLPQDVKELIDG